MPRCEYREIRATFSADEGARGSIPPRLHDDEGVPGSMANPCSEPHYNPRRYAHIILRDSEQVCVYVISLEAPGNEAQ